MLALGAVLLLVLAGGRVARRGMPAGGPLQWRATLALGPRRRVHLIEVEGTRVLIVAGSASESAIVLPPR